MLSSASSLKEGKNLELLGKKKRFTYLLLRDAASTYFLNLLIGQGHKSTYCCKYAGSLVILKDNSKTHLLFCWHLGS